MEDYEYLDLINPVNLFVDKIDFENFLDIRGGFTDEEYTEGLESLLVICNREELYEYSELVSQKLKEIHNEK